MTAISQKENNMSKYNMYVEDVSVEALLNKLGGVEGAKRFLRDELMLSEAVAKQLLQRLSTTIAVPAMTQFIAKDNFVINKSKNAKVKISFLGDNFKANFLQKIESEEVAAEELVVNKLLENSFDPAIITALGGEAKVEIALGQFFAAFAKQPKGEDGPLLTNGYANVGYIRDIKGVLWAVSGDWDDDGWRFSADPLGHPNYWRGGGQFFSR
ncbi:MAG: hypothetical protein WAW90_03145 [Minisyncoccia bacterium]